MPVSPYRRTHNKKISAEEVKENIRLYAENIIEYDPCENPTNRRKTACRCLRPINTNAELFDKTLELLGKYESLDQSGRQLFLHGAITHSNIMKQNLIRGQMRSCTFALNGVTLDDGDTVHLCHNSFRQLYCIGAKQWKKLCDEAVLPDPKNKTLYKDNMNRNHKQTQDVVDFLHKFGVDEGEAHATRFIRLESGTALRDSDVDMLQLPSFYSKRQLYERYCYDRGWEVRAFNDGSYPPVKKYKRRKNDFEDGDMALWPLGSEPLEVCSWPTFIRIWRNHLPHLKIRSPSLDTCTTCDVMTKSLRYNFETVIEDERNNEGESDETTMVCPVTKKPSILKNPDLESSREEIILEAAKHVKAARAQRALASQKMEKAETSEDRKVITLVIDYCQNLSVPHLGGEQPGDTYYYSPIWLYCLGIVDVSLGRLFAYTYPEYAANKGANNVASILVKHIINQYLSIPQKQGYNDPHGELNIIMDNCGGQNKNGVLLKLGSYLVEIGWFREINFIFLIKGHTKNECDRMFNLLKISWRKSNIYCFSQALEVLNSVDDVTAIDASCNYHHDYDKTFKAFYKQPVSGTIQKNHIFSFKKDNMNNVIMFTKRSANAKVTSSQSLKKREKPFQSKIRQLRLLHATIDGLDPIGLKPIKQVHLYTKWRKFIPQQYRDETCPLPSNETIRTVKKTKKMMMIQTMISHFLPWGRKTHQLKHKMRMKSLLRTMIKTKNPNQSRNVNVKSD